MSGLTIGSLFSGIGGLELGLERGIGEGCRTVWQVEQDEYCRAVLAKHWPDAQRFEDVKEVGSHNLSSVDLICGGFPCQDISYAGKGAGLAGERSGLWYEYARIIGELRPGYVVVENVAALLVRGLDSVLGSLASIGYDAEWDCITAAAVGAPHLRNRLFILAYPNGHAIRLQSLAGSERESTSLSRNDSAPEPVADAAGERCRKAGQRQPTRQAQRPRRSGEAPDTQSLGRRQGREGRPAGGGERPAGTRDIRDTTSERLPNGTALAMGESGSIIESQRPGWWTTEPDVGRVANGVRSRVDRLRALGNAVVPQVAEVVGRLIAEREKELRQSA